jgi:chemotaxis protein methyltransferase CheR
LLDAISTNHTSFFREAQHFDFLEQRVLPELLAQHRAGPLEVWSAACSSGEEPYTLAVVLREHLPAAAAVRILASDISTKVLDMARAGVYKLERVKDIPAPLLRKYFERGLGNQEGLARVKAELRRQVRFQQINLLEIGDLGTRFSILFCRNVMIYFDRAVQQRVVGMLERHLRPGGYLFISHSESLNGITHGLKWVAPAVYRRRDS